MNSLTLFESLQRAVTEIEVIESIYGSGHLTVRTPEELQAAIAAIESNETSFDGLRLKLDLNIQSSDVKARMHCTLPPGYPESSSLQVSVSSATLQRSVEDDISMRLQEKAEELIGVEAIMELAQNLEEMLKVAVEVESALCSENLEEVSTSSRPCLGRRWIWVHHITSSERRKSIVREARELGLAGYLKPGYPGVVVVEGESCDEFVKWIKGNKSRPGGFGRNWGHHVRGEVNVTDGKRRLQLEFRELNDDMKGLSALCSEHGLSEEFRDYVLQHKGSDRIDSGNVEYRATTPGKMPFRRSRRLTHVWGFSSKSLLKHLPVLEPIPFYTRLERT